MHSPMMNVAQVLILFQVSNLPNATSTTPVVNGINQLEDDIIDTANSYLQPTVDYDNDLLEAAPDRENDSSQHSSTREGLVFFYL